MCSSELSLLFPKPLLKCHPSEMPHGLGISDALVEFFFSSIPQDLHVAHDYSSRSTHELQVHRAHQSQASPPPLFPELRRVTWVHREAHYLGCCGLDVKVLFTGSHLEAWSSSGGVVSKPSEVRCSLTEGP